MTGLFSRLFGKGGDQREETPSDIPTVRPQDTRYFGQYSQSFDVQRPLEIFDESVAIARASRNPETAQSRYELALEAYRAARSFRLPPETEGRLDEAYVALRRDFPTLKVSNHTRGLINQGLSKKRRSTRLKYFRQAEEVLDLSSGKPGVDQREVSELRSEIRGLLSSLEE